jgi:AcrR family transcriptional regulator
MEQYAEMRSATRDKIITAAIEMFSLKGFSATGVQEIADSANISVGLLYRHYKTKDEIFGAILNEAMKGYEEVRKMFENVASPKEAIGLFADEVLGDIANNEPFIKMILLLTQPFMLNMVYPWMADLLEGNKQMVYSLADTIKKGQEHGEFRQGDSQQMAQFFFCAMQGMCITKHILQDKYIPPTKEMFMAFLLKEDDSGNN